jgi:hypothetical protein
MLLLPRSTTAVPAFLDSSTLQSSLRSLALSAERHMTFDPTRLVCTPHNWLETQVLYEGTGRAEFTTPPGVIEGPATVRFNPAGACRVSITVERIDAPDAEKFTLRPGGTLGTYLVHGETNPCISLTVQTEAGVFTGGDRILHGGSPLDGRQQFELCPLQSRFESDGAARAKYWVLPLANFMPDPWNGDVIPQLADHSPAKQLESGAFFATFELQTR